MPIDNNSPIPLYYQLKMDIISRIDSGALQPGEKLPTESWFCEHYGVSRVTVRKALDELILEGRIYRVRSKSAFVSNPKLNRQLTRLTGLHEELSQTGVHVRSRVLSSRTISAEGELAQRLHAKNGEQLDVIRRIRYANDKPIADQTIYLRKKYVPALQAEQLEQHSLYQIMEDELGLVIQYARQTIGAVMPSKEQVKLLEMKKEIPLLSLDRITFLDNGEPVEYTNSLYLSDSYNYSMVLYR